MEIMRRLYSEEEGQGLVEYALIIALISVVAIVAMRAVGVDIIAKFNEIVAAL
ncbi:Flp family type IVb pilin [Trichococcus collinsii]|uniref:Pilus assembly protein Flp/PilA n=1 Tax=Trichococcus collinsii TaxID=157076 RepID=A0AB37ZY68_9LACT|nr:Flp family type IVb pilin [Trichococcus collinsii]CZR09377.1 flp/fap pilin component [Trichococcus collinsii]SEA15819.1 pilus assembly protein Flp/PilA [Trichococcus collinsii]